MLKGKKVAILGDRDGIPGPAIEECVKSGGADNIFYNRMFCLNCSWSNGLGESSAYHGFYGEIR